MNQTFSTLIVIDECHRSGFGDWFGILDHFGSAFQLGLTATPREFDDVDGRELSDEEERRDTYNYFGDPVYTYSLKQAVEDGYLVPYLLEQRITNIDARGLPVLTGRNTPPKVLNARFACRSARLSSAEDLYAQLGQQGLLDEKVIVFCVDDTHAALFAQELRRVSGIPIMLRESLVRSGIVTS